MRLIDAIDQQKSLAESRGFKIGPQNIDGHITVTVTRVIGHGRTYHGFETVTEAAEFLRAQPELPRFKVRGTYASGDTLTVEIYDVSTKAALLRAVTEVAQARPDCRIKALEIL